MMVPIQNMYTYRIVGEGGGFDLPPGTTKLKMESSNYRIILS